MQVYLYQAELFCRDCGADHRAGLPIPEGANLDDESTWDSDAYPKGPYADGGGEADSPQHCGDCGVHLENPLTPDGVAYVRRKLTEYAVTGQGRDIILRQWADFYSLADNFAEEEGVEPLDEAEAAEYVPQWGSYMTAGDPGAIMYSRVPPEEAAHRDSMLRYVRAHCYPIADSGINDSDLDEGDESDKVKLRRLAAYLKGLDYADSTS